MSTALKRSLSLLVVALMLVSGVACSSEPATSQDTSSSIADTPDSTGISTTTTGAGNSSTTGRGDSTATHKPVSGSTASPGIGGETTTVKSTNKTTTTTKKSTTTTKTFPKVNWPVKPSYTIEQAAQRFTNMNYVTKDIPVEYVRVADYNPNYAFTHQQGMTYFKGKIYVTFSRGHVSEDFPGQEMVVVSSENFYDWSSPKTIGHSRQGTNGKTTIITGSLYTNGDRLFAYYVEHDWCAEKYDANGNFDPTASSAGTTSRILTTFTSDGINWSEPANLGIVSHESPRQTMTGEWLASWGAGMLYSDEAVPSGIYWDKVGLTSAQMQSAISRGAKMLGECSWFQTDDYVINMVMRSDTFRAWLAQSYDGGKTWTDAYPTNFQADWQMVYFGRLPNKGKFFFVGTTALNKHYGRYPLIILLSDDGYNFTRGYTLRDEVYSIKQEGWSKGGQYGYPEVMIHDGYLYVVCSRMKEVVELTRVKLSDIS